MPSTALAPDPAILDLDHLARMTFGEAALEREVLALFLTQSEDILRALADRPEEAAGAAHTLSGSARAIGAFAVAGRASELEAAALRGSAAALPLANLREALAQARGAIEARLGRR